MRDRTIVVLVVAGVLAGWCVGLLLGTPPSALAAAVGVGAMSGIWVGYAWDKRGGGPR